MRPRKRPAVAAPIVGRGLPQECSALADAAFDLLIGGESVVGLSGAMGKPRSQEWIEAGVKNLAAFLRSDEEIPPLMRKALAAAFDGGPVDEHSTEPGVRIKVSAPHRRTGWSILEEHRTGQIAFDAYEKARAAGASALDAKFAAEEETGASWRDLQSLVAERRADRLNLAKMEQARLDERPLAESFAIANSRQPRPRGRPRGSKKGDKVIF